MTTILPSYDISSETLVKNLIKEDVEGIASIFKALSDHGRIKILRVLEVNELCVCVFVEEPIIQISSMAGFPELIPKIEKQMFKALRQP